MKYVSTLLLLFSSLFFALPAHSLQTVWVAGTDAQGRVHVAQGDGSANRSVKFKSTWRMDREAKPKPKPLRVTNRLQHKVKILYYNSGDTVRLVAAGVIHLKPGQSSNFPRTAHRIKVFKPAIFDKHLATSQILRGHVTLRPQGSKVRFEGGRSSGPTMSFINETEESIKICIYDRGDMLQAIPKKIVKLAAGASGSWPVESGTHKVKVFCPAIFDQWLVDGNFHFNSTIRVKQGFWSATGVTADAGCGVGASLHFFDNSAIDGAATSAHKFIYFFEEGKLKVGHQTAQATTPLRFILPADYGWGDALDTGIGASGLRGAPAAITYDVGNRFIPRFQTRLFAVSDAGALKTVATAKWAHDAAVRKWNGGAAWTTLLNSGVTHVGAGERIKFPEGASYVVYRREDGTLHGAIFDEAEPRAGWRALGGGSFQGGAAVAYSTEPAGPSKIGPATIEVFAVRDNGDLMRKIYRTEGGWGPWARVRGGCHGTPSAWHSGGRIHLAVGTGSGNVATSRTDSESGWLPWCTIPGSIASSPVIYVTP